MARRVAAVAGVVAVRPTKLRLLGKNWTVAYRPVLPSKDEIGECLSETQTINIKHGLKPEQERSTILHECIHAIDYSLGLGLTEKQVMGLEAGLYDLANSNPRFFSYIKKKDASD